MIDKHDHREPVISRTRQVMLRKRLLENTTKMNKNFAPARIAISGLLALGLSGGVAATTASSQASAATPVPTRVKAAGFSARMGAQAVNVAATKRGTPYRYGAAGPRAFDCSGLVQWTYARVGKKMPRTAQDQYRATKRIARSTARPGDLVFYGSSQKYHVGIYAGNGKMWHAPRTGQNVKLVNVYGSPSYGRVR